MTHLEAAERKAEVYRFYLDWMQDHRGERWPLKRFYDVAVEQFPCYRKDSIRKIIYAKGDTISVSRAKSRKDAYTEWSSSWNLYIDHEDGRGYYGERPRSYLDKLIVESVDIDADVWRCTGKRGICAGKLKRLTAKRLRRAA